MRLATLCLIVFALLTPLSRAQAPVFAATPEESAIRFYVKASVALTGKFDKWDTALAFSSPDVTSGVLDIRIDAATVNTGSGMKDSKLKSSDFFDVKQNPTITFRSTKVTQTGPVSFDVGLRAEQAGVDGQPLRLAGGGVEVDLVDLADLVAVGIDDGATVPVVCLGHLIWCVHGIFSL